MDLYLHLHYSKDHLDLSHISLLYFLTLYLSPSTLLFFSFLFSVVYSILNQSIIISLSVLVLIYQVLSFIIQYQIFVLEYQKLFTYFLEKICQMNQM
jgi:hypothetical protein